MPANLNLIVLRCRDIHKSKQFYEVLGLQFVEEQHGKSPVHFAYEGYGIVIELYPQSSDASVSNITLGFRVVGLDSTLSEFEKLGYAPKAPPRNNRCTILDPDGNVVMLEAR